jgi:hypothetical protein
MKRILRFGEFINENEKEKEKEKDVSHLPRLNSVVDKQFFAELKEHISYWICFDFLKDKYSLTTLENTENEVTVWFSDIDNKPLYEYKVIYTTLENDKVMIEKREDVKMIISIYDFETSELLKQTEQKVDIKYLNAKSFDNLLKIVKKRILKTPKNSDDIEDFRRKEKRRLGDNIY